MIFDFVAAFLLDIAPFPITSLPVFQSETNGARRLACRIQRLEHAFNSRVYIRIPCAHFPPTLRYVRPHRGEDCARSTWRRSHLEWLRQGGTPPNALPVAPRCSFAGYNLLNPLDQLFRGCARTPDRRSFLRRNAADTHPLAFAIAPRCFLRITTEEFVNSPQSFHCHTSKDQ